MHVHRKSEPGLIARREIRWLTDGLLVLVLAGVLTLLSVPPALALAGAVLLGLAVITLGRERSALLLVVLSLALTVAVLEGALRLGLSPSPTYYRPHERLMVAGSMPYRANQSVTMDMPFGDLYAIADQPIESVREPRHVRFETDDLGLRNERPYAGESVVLFGDSFVVGNGSDQDRTLSAFLQRDHGLAAYNAGFPTNVHGYVYLFRVLRDRHGSDFRAVFFLSEANDFPCAAAQEGAGPPSDEEPEAMGERVHRAVMTPVRNTQVYRFFFGVTRRAFRRFAPGEVRHGRVMVTRVAEHDMAFYQPYVETATREHGCDWSSMEDALREVADQAVLIVFIPTKYRVYRGFLVSDPALPNAQWEFTSRLAERIGVPALDLTPYLEAEARRQAPAGRFVYWRDDTHWNPLGMRVAAGAVAEALTEGGAGTAVPPP